MSLEKENYIKNNSLGGGTLIALFTGFGVERAKQS
jgi:hypothetical protein